MTPQDKYSNRMFLAREGAVLQDHARWVGCETCFCKSRSFKSYSCILVCKLNCFALYTISRLFAHETINLCRSPSVILVFFFAAIKWRGSLGFRLYGFCSLFYRFFDTFLLLIRFFGLVWQLSVYFHFSIRFFEFMIIRKSVFQFSLFYFSLSSPSSWIATKFGADVLHRNQKIF